MARFPDFFSACMCCTLRKEENNNQSCPVLLGRDQTEGMGVEGESSGVVVGSGRHVVGGSSGGSYVVSSSSGGSHVVGGHGGGNGSSNVHVLLRGNLLVDVGLGG